MASYCSQCQIAWPDAESSCGRCGRELEEFVPRPQPEPEPDNLFDPILVLLGLVGGAAGAIIGGWYYGTSGAFAGFAIGFFCAPFLPFALAS